MYPVISIFIMALVTYIPRAIPIAFCKKTVKSVFIRSFLFYVPYAVLAALTFPSIFYCTNNLTTALIGTIISCILSCFRVKMIYVVMVAILIVYGLGFII